jgi:hypothetical protein
MVFEIQPRGGGFCLLGDWVTSTLQITKYSALVDYN